MGKFQFINTVRLTALKRNKVEVIGLKHIQIADVTIYRIRHGITVGEATSNGSYSVGDIVGVKNFAWFNLELPNHSSMVELITYFGDIVRGDTEALEPNAIDLGHGYTFLFKDSIEDFERSLIEIFLDSFSKCMRIQEDSDGRLVAMPNPPPNLEKEGWWFGEYFDTAKMYQHIHDKAYFGAAARSGLNKINAGQKIWGQRKTIWKKLVETQAEIIIQKQISNGKEKLVIADIRRKIISHFNRNPVRDEDTGKLYEPVKESSIDGYVSNYIAKNYPDIHPKKQR